MKYKSRRSSFALLNVLLAFGLSGCSAVEDYVLQKSEISADADYQQYETWREEGSLEADGSYHMVTDETETERPDGSVCVTFSDNPYLKVSYYYDEERTQAIDMGSPCYLKPGEWIYSSEPVCEDMDISTYHFAQFHVYAWDGSSRRELDWETSDGGQGLAVQIPEDYTGAELSIEPTGMVENYPVTLEDYVDKNGNHQELNGTWTVNDVSTDQDSIEASPIAPLRVEYQYDADKYNFVKSDPSSYYHENGKVCFDTVSATDGVKNFSVQLRSREEGQFYFDPAEYTFEHGTVTFYYLGQQIVSPRDLKDGVSLEYRVDSTEEGYYSPEPEGVISVSAADQNEVEATDAAIQAIPIFRQETVLVHLPQPSAGGTIQYFIEGELVEEDFCEVQSGSAITLNFLPWNGWYTNCQDDSVYHVTEQADQLLYMDAEGDNFPQVFQEDSQHKPTLAVVLKDGIMPEAEFSIAAAGSEVKGQKYSTDGQIPFISDWFGQDDCCIFNVPVSTEEGITVSVENAPLISGKALRMEIRMKDDQKRETTSIRYITKLPCKEHIDIYSDPASDTTVYKEIQVIFSQVKVVTYESAALANGFLEVSLADVSQPQVLQDGDVLETSRKVKVTVYPDSGYYVTGGKEEGDSYSTSMKYSKWLSDSEEILGKHSIRPFWAITLDSSDPYGICVYELDGEEVSGTIEVKDEQKLALKYTLKDKDYEIVRSGVNEVFHNVVGKDEEKVEISLSEKLDGTTIRRSDYIQVERKED